MNSPRHKRRHAGGLSRLACLTIAGLAFSGQVAAQDAPAPTADPATTPGPNAMHMLVAADSSSGTYKEMLAEIAQFCQTPDLAISQIPNSGGAVGNLQALVDNKAEAAFLHSDVLQASSMFDKRYNNYKTLLALYPEDIHILVLRNATVSSGGVNVGFGHLGGSSKPINTLADLAGRNIGAAGGGVKTMQILKGQGELNFNAIAFDSGSDVLPALQSGKIDAAIFVGGAPLPNLAGLKWQDYKLIGIDDTIQNRLKEIYRSTTISYDNLRASQVSTLAPMATLVTRQYKTPKFIKMQTDFRACFYKHLDEMKETPGLHPKWQEVQPWDRGTWTWLDLPGDQDQPKQ